MTALSTPRATDEVQGVLRQVPVKGGALMFQGALAMAVAGLAQPGAPAANAVALGRVEWGCDNRNGADGAASVMVKRGVFLFANAAADPVPAAQIGAPCFILDDQTVAATNGGGARSPAGRVFNVEADGVWVEIV